MPDNVQASSSPRVGALVRRGSFIAIGSYGASQLIRLGSNLVLTRLLEPEVFGLMALVQSIIIGLHLFSDVGIGPSIVQSEKGDRPEFLHTAFSVQAFRGLMLWLLCCLAAYPVSSFYEDERLLWIMPVLGFATVLSGLQSTKFWIHHREIKLGRLAIIEMVTQIASIALMLVLAWIHRSVWALVIANVVSDALRTSLTHVALPGLRDRFQLDRTSLRNLIRFGRWIFVSTIVTFFVTQLDRLLLGKVTDFETLGMYSIAVVLASMPSNALGHLTGTVLLPAYSRVIQQHGRLTAESFLRIRGPMLVVAAWVLSGMIAGGPVIVEMLYDDRYVDAGWIVQILCAGAWFMVIETTVSPSLLAMGQSQWMAAGNVMKLVGMAAMIPVAFAWYGFPGAVAAYAASELWRYVFSTVLAHRRGLNPLAQDIRNTAMLTVGAVGAWSAERGIEEWTHNVVIRALVVFVVVTAVFAWDGRKAWRRFRAERAADRESLANVEASAS